MRKFNLDNPLLEFSFLVTTIIIAAKWGVWWMLVYWAVFLGGTLFIVTCFALYQGFRLVMEEEDGWNLLKQAVREWWNK